ncbi:hypothetical protein E2C01_049881 [Portunus trituberculatus]|uniref:Uncharacterized protein n=1 Tax=Portunus trituberculatus TaxID=210409 RepID=A0A5B7GF21_PORTR|nr:hypothetical protein [Portunus trituberculatus]
MDDEFIHQGSGKDDTDRTELAGKTRSGLDELGIPIRTISLITSPSLPTSSIQGDNSTSGTSSSSSSLNKEPGRDGHGKWVRRNNAGAACRGDKELTGRRGWRGTEGQGHRRGEFSYVCVCGVCVVSLASGLRDILLGGTRSGGRWQEGGRQEGGRKWRGEHKIGSLQVKGTKVLELFDLPVSAKVTLEGDRTLTTTTPTTTTTNTITSTTIITTRS